MTTTPETLTATQQKLVVRLEHELVAPCCYSQVVADHMSDAASQMRQEIEQAILSGRSEGQVIDAYKGRYGPMILAAPDGITGTIAFSVPPFLTFLGVCLVVMQMRRWMRRNRDMYGESEPAVVDPRLLERIRAEVFVDAERRSV